MSRFNRDAAIEALSFPRKRESREPAAGVNPASVVIPVPPCGRNPGQMDPRFRGDDVLSPV
ncbi:MAG: hypothetical protein ABSB82_14395 [Terriglobia bacterium]